MESAIAALAPEALPAAAGHRAAQHLHPGQLPAWHCLGPDNSHSQARPRHMWARQCPASHRRATRYSPQGPVSVRATTSTTRSHICGGLEYIGKCASRRISASSRSSRVRCLHRQHPALPPSSVSLTAGPLANREPADMCRASGEASADPGQTRPSQAKPDRSRDRVRVSMQLPELAATACGAHHHGGPHMRSDAGIGAATTPVRMATSPVHSGSSKPPSPQPAPPRWLSQPPRHRPGDALLKLPV